MENLQAEKDEASRQAASLKEKVKRLQAIINQENAGKEEEGLLDKVHSRDNDDSSNSKRKSREEEESPRKTKLRTDESPAANTNPSTTEGLETPKIISDITVSKKSLLDKENSTTDMEVDDANKAGEVSKIPVTGPDINSTETEMTPFSSSATSPTHTKETSDHHSSERDETLPPEGTDVIGGNEDSTDVHELLGDGSDSEEEFRTKGQTKFLRQEDLQNKELESRELDLPPVSPLSSKGHSGDSE